MPSTRNHPAHHFRRLGAALRILRVRRGLSQTDLAERCGLSPPMIRSYEREAVIPSLRSLDRLLVAAEADIHQLSDALQMAQRQTFPLHRPSVAVQAEHQLYASLQAFQGDPRRQRAVTHILIAVTEAMVRFED